MSVKPKWLYEKVVDYYESKILSGEHSSGEKLPTEASIAEKFDVSLITAKKALAILVQKGYIYKVRGSGSYVSDFCEQLNGRAAGFGPSPKLIAVILPFNPFEGGMMQCVKSISDYFGVKDCFVSVHNSDFDHEKEAKLLTELSKKVDGIILYPISEKNDDILYMLSIKNHNIVVIDKYFSSVTLPGVTSDSRLGGELITNEFIKRGHKKIMYCALDIVKNASTSIDRYLGYCKALVENGLENETNVWLLKWVYNTDENLLNNDLIEMISECIREDITAIFVFNDVIALRTANILKHMGASEKIEIAGFDNIPELKYNSCNLITIEQDFIEMGRVAAELLHNLINNRDIGDPQKILPVKLIDYTNEEKNIFIDNAENEGICV